MFVSCYKLDETRLKFEFDKLATALFQQTCSKSVDKLATNLMPTSLLQHRHDRVATIKSVDKLLQVCHNNIGTTSASTSCEQVVGADLLQVCCRFVTSCACTPSGRILFRLAQGLLTVS
jgi:hypothetical protein